MRDEWTHKENLYNLSDGRTVGLMLLWPVNLPAELSLSAFTAYVLCK